MTNHYAFRGWLNKGIRFRLAVQKSVGRPAVEAAEDYLWYDGDWKGWEDWGDEDDFLNPTQHPVSLCRFLKNTIYITASQDLPKRRRINVWVDPKPTPAMSSQ